MKTVTFLTQLFLCVAFVGSTLVAAAAPGYGPPLDLIRGHVYEVDSLDDLKNAINAANDNGQPATLLIAPGTYTLDIPMFHITCPDLVIRSAQGDRNAVILRGPDEGPGAVAAHIFLVSADNVVIADLTLGYCRYHGIQVQGESPHDVSGLLVHNCRLVNINEQFIKGSSADNDPVGATDGIIEHCLFEFTAGWAYQYYTGGIDIHKGVNWVVRDNLFRGIRVPAGQPGMAEHAIHFWKRCSTRPQNVVVERNQTVNCDRGIGFGLGSLDGGHQGGTSVIRNNFVYNDGIGSQTDVGIGLEHADHVTVDNNTVVVEGYWAPMEYRFTGSSDLRFRNNLVNGTITRRDGAPLAESEGNLESAPRSWFRDLVNGDLHLTTEATGAIDEGAALSDFTEDIDRETRPQLGEWDIGADEYNASGVDSDDDGMPDLWESARGLDPFDATGDNGRAGDPDQDVASNWHEYQADTHPNDAGWRLEMIGIQTHEGQVEILWQGGLLAGQELLRCDHWTAAPESWETVASRTTPTPREGVASEAFASRRQAFYRVRATRLTR